MRAFHWLDPRGGVARLGYAALLAGVTYAATAGLHSDVARVLMAGDVGGVVMLACLAAIILRTTASEARRRAAAEDPGGHVVWILVLAVSAFSVFATTFVLRHDAAGSVRALAPATAIIAWLVTHASFTLRYAHLYYRDARDAGGLDFHGSRPPDDLDFAYFAFTIGMCFQVSDTNISDQRLRRTALGHALLSFAYNTVILALVLDIVTARH